MQLNSWLISVGGLPLNLRRPEVIMKPDKEYFPDEQAAAVESMLIVIILVFGILIFW